eukprot:4389594-Pleurochrysis_carterae.AAC.1
MGSPECFGSSAAIGDAFLELKTELRASGSLYPAVEPISHDTGCKFSTRLSYMPSALYAAQGWTASARDSSACGGRHPPSLSG